MENFARKNLFEPLGISKVEWNNNPGGHISLGHGIDMRPIDVAKIGILIDNQGVWKEQRIVSEQWLKDSLSKHGTLLGIDYGYLWYSENYEVGGKTIESFLAMGHGGQFLIWIPEVQSIIVIAASDYEMEIDFYNLIREQILPKLF